MFGPRPALERKRKKDWITLDTWKIIDKRRKVKKKAQEAKYIHIYFIETPFGRAFRSQYQKSNHNA